MPNTKEPLIDEAFEQKVLACLLHVTEFAAVASQHLKAGHFSNPQHHNIAKIGCDFFKKYGARPSAKAIVDELVTAINPKDLQAYGKKLERLKKTDKSDYKWVLEKLIVFIKNREIKRLIDDSVKRHLPKNDFGQIEKEMARIAAISADIDTIPTFHFKPDEIDQRLARREDEHQQMVSGRPVGISTGIPAMDRTLPKGGWAKRELYTLLAGAKRGKTMALLWMANYAAWQGYFIPFFSLETRKDILADRVDAMNTMIETKMLVNRRLQAHRLLNSRIPKGQIAFYEYPTKCCTVGEIDRQLERLEIEYNFKTDMLVVDYGDIMKPARTYRDDKLAEQAGIFEDLRAIATKYDIPVLTASQVNRSGVGKAKNTGSDVSGSYEKIMVSDCVITMSATEDERSKGLLRIHFSESRNSEAKTFLIETKYAIGTFYKDLIEEEL